MKIMTKPKIIGVIPARYQSSCFTGKPLADICGKSMKSSYK
jgi:3-deoxy-manno-octulosonate cytidylyltransferase (CMP-KDO synthetase)